MKSVAVIGQGLWGNKIVKSIQNHFSDYVVESLSSRNFLGNPVKKTYDVMWVAGRPSDQLKIIEIAQFTSRRIILEKPICSTLDEFSQVENIIMNENAKFELSRPWCFSNTWITAKEKIRSWDLHESSVNFERSGPSVHLFITSIEDWLPHDIYLASDLFPGFENEFSIDFCDRTSSELQLSLKSQTKTILNFSFTESKFKKSTIEIKSASGELHVNFGKKYVEFDGQACEIVNPNTYDEISRNFDAAFNSDNKKTIELVHTQKWIKALINQTK
jgi:predicted dehydrogenase